LTRNVNSKKQSLAKQHLNIPPGTQTDKPALWQNVLIARAGSRMPGD
jgi:hypothetical protein